jgi:hypothetical protein
MTIHFASAVYQAALGSSSTSGLIGGWMQGWSDPLSMSSALALGVSGTIEEKKRDS